MTTLTLFERGTRRSARYQLAYRLKLGQVRKGACEVGVDCRGVIDGHHDDYSRPLDVRWLCRRHHQRLHTEQRAQGKRRTVPELSLISTPPKREARQCR